LKYFKLPATGESGCKLCRNGTEFHAPLPPSKKLRFSHPALSKRVAVVVVVVKKNILTPHVIYKRKESDPKFLPDTFWSFQIKFCSSVD
jgi:hypothetical protein